MADQYKNNIQETVVLSSRKLAIIAGGAAGDRTVTGIRTRDKLISVIRSRPTTPGVITTAFEDLGAGADITERAFFRVPDALAGYVITAVHIVMRGASAGVDNANTAVVTVSKVGVGNIASKTYNTATQPAAANAADSLGAITNGTLAAGQILAIAVTQGATANLPAFDVVIDATIPAAASDLTSEFTITADNTINNAAGTASTGETLFVNYLAIPAGMG